MENFKASTEDWIKGLETHLKMMSINDFEFYATENANRLQVYLGEKRFDIYLDKFNEIQYKKKNEIKE